MLQGNQTMSNEVQTEEGTEVVDEAIDVDQMRAGYYVAIDDTGNFQFRLFGKACGAVEVSGLHAYATRRITDVIDAREKRNSPLLRELAKLLLNVQQEVRQLANKVDPPKPDNKL